MAEDIRVPNILLSLKYEPKITDFGQSGSVVNKEFGHSRVKRFLTSAGILSGFCCIAALLTF
ncbi:hypothetical protein CR513_50553, partial [Mucuna pruriens]